MQLFVMYEIFETIVGENVSAAREKILARLSKLLKSGVVSNGGAFVDARSGFFTIEADTSEKLFDLLGGDFIHTCRLEMHAVISLERLLELVDYKDT